MKLKMIHWTNDEIAEIWEFKEVNTGEAREVVLGIPDGKGNHHEITVILRED